MDLEHLQITLRNLQPRQDLAVSTAEYIIRNNQQNEDTIGKMLQKQFCGSHYQHKLALLMVVSQILLQSSRLKIATFFQSLSIKAKNFLTDLAQTDDIRCSRQITQILERWMQQEIFHMNFLRKLKEAITPAYTRIAKQQERISTQKYKYGKTFLMEIADIKAVNCCEKVYECYVQNKKMQSDISTLYQQCNKINVEKPTQQASERAKQLVKVAEDHKQRLMKLIQDYHESYKVLHASCTQQISKAQK